MQKGMNLSVLVPRVWDNFTSLFIFFFILQLRNNVGYTRYDYIVSEALTVAASQIVKRDRISAR